MGGTPWEFRDRYIENSPIFFLDRIDTPLLIAHGGEDRTVSPFLGDELFVALRRLGKEVEYAKYEGEGHSPIYWSYPNQLDFGLGGLWRSTGANSACDKLTVYVASQGAFRFLCRLMERCTPTVALGSPSDDWSKADYGGRTADVRTPVQPPRPVFDPNDNLQFCAESRPLLRVQAS